MVSGSNAGNSVPVLTVRLLSVESVLTHLAASVMFSVTGAPKSQRSPSLYQPAKAKPLLATVLAATISLRVTVSTQVAGVPPLASKVTVRSRSVAIQRAYSVVSLVMLSVEKSHFRLHSALSAYQPAKK